MKLIKPVNGKVIIYHEGKRIEFPTEATEDILSIPVVKLLLQAGRLALEEEKPASKPTSTKEDKPLSEKPKRKPGRPPKSKKDEA